MNTTEWTSTHNPHTRVTYKPTPSPGSDDSCDIYKDWRRRSKGFIIRGYEGIPQNLILNMLGLIILVVAFSFLRKKAWNYGRIALLNDVGWATIFYRASVDKVRGTKPEETPSDENGIDDTGYFDWIKITCKLTDDQFLQKSGPDALQYLSYQRHLIFLGAIITLASLIIVLPLNLHGSSESDTMPDISIFEQSTIFNLGSHSRLLWVHEMLALAFLGLSVVVMRHFSRSLRFVQFDPASRRTLLVAGIAKRYCTEGRIRSHFLALHPDCVIDEFSLAYDVSKLVELNDEKEAVVTARKYWEEFMLHNHTASRPIMRPYTCGNICCCCCCLMHTTDALTYYTNLEYKLRRYSELERKRAYAKPLGIAFVTFSTVEMADKILKEYRLTARLLMQIPVTKYSRRLKSRNWVVAFAPLPDDLYWQHLSLGYRAWYFRAFVVNLTLVVIVLFYSTPVFLLNALSVYLKIQKLNGESSSGDGNTTTTPAPPNSTTESNFNLNPSTIEGVLRDTVPTFLLWLAAVTLPSLVSLSDRFVGFWTKTAENRSKMIKTFTFLLFMVIILPSLGLTSASSFFLRDEPPRWKCIFSPSNGSFFVNYVITSCFLGTVSELMRIPELLVYGFKICFAKSAADIGAVRKSVLWDFQLGSQYAWMMLIFAIFILFSLVTPIITIFGFIYLIFKHYVDRYNIYFAYGPCKVDKAVHGTAINFVIICAFLLQLILVAYTHSNATPVILGATHKQPNEVLNRPLQSFTILGFCVTATFFIGQVFFNMCTSFSAISYTNTVPVAVPPLETQMHRERRQRRERQERRERRERKALRESRERREHPERFLPIVLPTSRPVSPRPKHGPPVPIVSPPRPSGDTLTEETPLHIMALGVRASRSLQRNADASDTLSTTTESIGEHMEHVEPEPQNLYRPGIDKPYGHYFPKILQLEFDRESTIEFYGLYFKEDDLPEFLKPAFTNTFVRNELVIESHNKLPLHPELSRVQSVAVVVSHNVSEDSTSSSSSSEEEGTQTTVNVPLPASPDANSNHPLEVHAHDGERLN